MAVTKQADRLELQRPQRSKYDPVLPFWLNCYVVLQFLSAFYASIVDVVRLTTAEDEAISQAAAALVVAASVFWSLTSCGQIYDGKPGAWKSELLRLIEEA